MTKEIPLTQGQVAIVDDWRYDELNQYKWYAQWDSHTKSYYAARNSKMILGKRTKIFMHTVVARTPKGLQTDHINHDTLYNCTDNLRVCTRSQNQMNQTKKNDNTSGYKGVSAFRKSWQAKIGLNGRDHYIGVFSTKDEAARAYDEAAKRLHGEFATFNFREVK